MIRRTIYAPLDRSDEDLAVLKAGLSTDEASRESVRALLARDPTWIERIGTLASETERLLLGSLNAQVVSEEGWHADLERLRGSLPESGDGPLERLLVEHVVLSWLALTLAEIKHASSQDRSIVQAGFWDRHVSRRSRDFDRACKTLATVRRLRIGSVQVNIAEKQVNVAR